MPEIFKQSLFYTPVLALFLLITALNTATCAYEGIETYYIRYDVISSKNRIINDNLLMVPAKNEFRAEKFSLVTTTGVISAVSGESKITIEQRIKNNFLKAILVNNGLKSVKVKDYDTVVSYEGVIITPLNILKNSYNEEQDNFLYEVQVEFSPIAFPDRWETLNMKYRIKKIFHDFFQFF